MTRCRPGIVTGAEFVKVPDQRCTAAHCTASGTRRSGFIPRPNPFPLLRGPLLVVPSLSGRVTGINFKFLAGRTFTWVIIRIASTSNAESRGDYAIRKGGSDRASGTAPTQREAIDKAEKMFPDQKPLIERVRETNKGGRDKWRTE